MVATSRRRARLTQYTSYRVDNTKDRAGILATRFFEEGSITLPVPSPVGRVTYTGTGGSIYAASAGMNGASAFTMMCWYRPLVIDGNFHPLMAAFTPTSGWTTGGGLNTNEGWGVHQATSNRSIHNYYRGVGGPYGTEPAPRIDGVFTAGQWVHVACVVTPSGTTMTNRVLINGTHVGTISDNGPTFPTGTLVPNWGNSEASPTDGTFAMMRAWQGALTDNEIRAEMYAGAAVKSGALVDVDTTSSSLTNRGSGGSMTTYSGGTYTYSATDGPYLFLPNSVTVNLGQATESDTALGSTEAKVVTLGLATESDTALALTASSAVTVNLGQAQATDIALALSEAKGRATGQATEADSVLALSASKADALTQATESDAVLAVGRSKVVTLGLVTEADTALGSTEAKATALGLVTEADTALGSTEAKTVTLGLATESDTALAVSSSSAVTVNFGQTTESDTGLALGRSKVVALGLATESDATPALTVSKSRVMMQATEVATAFGVQITKTRTLGLATVTESGLVVTTAKVVTLGRANEADEAFALTLVIPQEGLVPPYGSHVTAVPHGSTPVVRLHGSSPTVYTRGSAVRVSVNESSIEVTTP